MGIPPHPAALPGNPMPQNLPPPLSPPIYPFYSTLLAGTSLSPVMRAILNVDILPGLPLKY